MKLVLEVKNSSKIINPTTDNVILYDGKQWYVTTKEQLFAEFIKKMNTFIEDSTRLISELKIDNERFKAETSKEIVEMSRIVKKIYEEN